VWIDTDPNNPSRYSPSTDEIFIVSPEDVWEGGFDWGSFVAAHEYGHAFHEKTLDGNVGSGSCPSPHFLDTESNLRCAFSEGFANYTGGATRPDLGSYYFQDYMEGDRAFPGCAERESTHPYDCIGGTSYEGSLIEGAYAAFLYDLTDSAVESHDAISGPGSYVADLVRSCNVYYVNEGYWRRANGPDEMAYCAENAINPDGYFTPRGSVPLAYSESAVEPGDWSPSRVHSGWTWNMYEKR
jgi:hypothetical protein